MSYYYKSKYNLPQEGKEILQFFNNLGIKYKQYIPEFNQYGYVMLVGGEGGNLKYSQPYNSIQSPDDSVSGYSYPFGAPISLMGRGLLNKLYVEVTYYIQNPILLYQGRIISSFDDAKPNHLPHTWWDYHPDLAGQSHSWGDTITERIDDVVVNSLFKPPEELQLYIKGDFIPTISYPEGYGYSYLFFTDITNLKTYLQRKDIVYTEPEFSGGDVHEEYSESQLNAEYDAYFTDWFTPSIPPNQFDLMDAIKQMGHYSTNIQESYYKWKIIITTVLLETDNSGSYPRYLYRSTYSPILVKIGTGEIVNWTYMFISALFSSVTHAPSEIMWSASSANMVMDLDYVLGVTSDVSPLIIKKSIPNPWEGGIILA